MMKRNTAFLQSIIFIVSIIGISVSTAATYPAEYDSVVARQIINSLDIDQFKSYIKSLADFGGRAAGSQSNGEARNWIETTMDDLGYDNVETQSNYKNVYCTKEGSVSPDSMYIISAHFDGMKVARAANDDASGCALVLETARLLANPLIKTHYSIRFILWNNEETGLQGSKAYVAERDPYQGQSEPVWLGMIQHDMILFDHGLPPQEEQAEDADIDVEYKSGTKAEAQSLALAEELVTACEDYAPDYPAEIGPNMSNTDSDPFKNVCAAVSMRENCRLSEIGNGSDPHWHTETDLYETFSDDDFLLGYNTMQTTVGAVCRLAGVYDSTPTYVTIPESDIHSSFFLSRNIKEIKVFDMQGRKVAEHRGLSNWRKLSGVLKARELLPAGLYVVQAVSNKDNKRCRFVTIVQ